MGDILLQENGEPWLTDEDKTVPKKCPICGEEMGLFFYGEPVFLCKSNEQHYYGTLKFIEDLPLTVEDKNRESEDEGSESE